MSQVPARSISRGSGLVDPWFLCRGDLVNIEGVDDRVLSLARQLAQPWLAEAPAQGAQS